MNIVSVIDINEYDYSKKEKIREGVFKAIYNLNLDNTYDITDERWNPFNAIVKPGMQVLLKPNFVMDYNQNANAGTDCLFTQPELIYPVIELLCRALCGYGKIIIGDAPMQECNFENIIGHGLDKIVDSFKSSGVEISVVDFRELKSTVDRGVHKQQIVENAGGIIVKLDAESEFADLSKKELASMRITNYDPRILPQHHNENTHEYYISKYLLESDVVINMPKPKSHRKAGVTISLKNFVGVNTRKEFLPHHTLGSSVEGGDEYYQKSHVHKIRSRLFDLKNQKETEQKYNLGRALGLCIKCCTAWLKLRNNKYWEGSWYGNDTISRTIVDLNRIVIYADKKGNMQPNPCRKILIIADMVVAGEKEGPVCPSPKPLGIIAAGTNTVCFDETICTLMGFDYHKIPAIVRARKVKNYPLVVENMKPLIVSNVMKFNNKQLDQLDYDDLYNFQPTDGWKGHIEL